MYGMNADGWLAVHHVEHRELLEKAERTARRRPARAERPAPSPVAAAVPVSTAPVCC
ncbi:hypothetical protein ACFFGH_20810 [Lysobacter korlensis]|uniref:Uncharacterized protein n=1 Tax=Lysobacter korlensis TaxID=553636 RepID=A0ABV6RTH4_9GAMM